MEETSYTNHHQIELNDKNPRRGERNGKEKHTRKKTRTAIKKFLCAIFVTIVNVAVDHLNVGCCGIAIAADDGGRGDFCDFN